MKRILVLVLLIGFCNFNLLFAESNSGYNTYKGFSIEISYWNALAMGGTTQVREWNTEGTRFLLGKDLGMSNYYSFDLWIGYSFPKWNNLRFSFGRYFFRGHQVLKETSYYNGSELIQGTDASIDASVYFRVCIHDRLLIFRNQNNFKFFLIFGINVDLVRFHVDGELSSSTLKRETWETYYRQPLPLPIYGVRFEKGLDNDMIFYSELYGGFIPGLKLWNWEVTRMRQWQVDLDAEVGFYYPLKVMDLYFNIHYKMLYLKSEDVEDTNELFIFAIGPEFKIAFKF